MKYPFADTASANKTNVDDSDPADHDLFIQIINIFYLLFCPFDSHFGTFQKSITYVFYG